MMWKPYTAVGDEVIVGLYDTKDNVWLGDETGPNLFPQQTIEQAKFNEVRAEIASCQIHYEMDRIRVKEWQSSSVRLRDTIDVKMSAEDAVKRLEAGE